MHQNTGIESNDVAALVHEPAPPQVLHISLELDSERPVVPCIRQTAVNVRAWKHEPATLAERGHLLHGDDARLLGSAHRIGLSRCGGRAAPGNMLNALFETAKFV